VPASLARVLETRGSATTAVAAELRTLFAKMVEIRAVETALLDLFAAGKLRGTVHTCLGQEAIAAGIVGALDLARDAVCSNHRGHGHSLAYLPTADWAAWRPLRPASRSPRSKRARER
jgi:TPP-dependent pyruvate/acetoin dehydrogenase alpha subunit